MAIGTTAAIGLGVAAAGTAGSIITGNKAASAAQQSAQQASDTQLQLFDRAAALQAPFIQQGQRGLNLFSNIVTGNTDAVFELPGIAYAREQGEQALERMQSARGNFLSGAAIKEGLRFNQGLASTNYNTVVGDLFRLGSLGQNAASFTGQGAINTGSGVANAQLFGGQAAAAGHANVGSSINSGLNNALFSYLYSQNPGGGG